MASATVDLAAAAATTDGDFLRLDSIPVVDLRLLSQSELYSLSRCSSSDSDPSCRDDVVIPIIDRSVFNESAGSRKQTYSRLRLAPSDSSSAAAPRSRTPHLRSTGAGYGAINSKSDPENAENYQIINLLKQFFVADMNPADLFPVKIEYSNSLPVQQFSSPPQSSPSNVAPTGLKRKRGRPRRNEFLGNGEELAVEVSVVNASDVDRLPPIPLLNEIVVRDNAAEDRDREVLNSDGVAVDLAALGAVEHPYWEEIRHRTEGLLTEEELLGFLKGLNGKWGSRRKKKRIVEASEFGSKLPVGWKLLLSVKKKNGHVWLYCRRYISNNYSFRIIYYTQGMVGMMEWNGNGITFPHPFPFLWLLCRTAESSRGPTCAAQSSRRGVEEKRWRFNQRCTALTPRCETPQGGPPHRPSEVWISDKMAEAAPQMRFFTASPRGLISGTMNLPSGLHFVSCKGVSSYLLSLHGVHDPNPFSSARYNDIVNDADQLTSVTLATEDDSEIENLVSRASLPHMDSAAGNHEIQVVVNAGNLPEDRIGESLCCNKCNITFNDKDEFMQHQSSLHRKNRNKNVIRITDGVIIKDGKYECQFCHKTFNERHRYNGHVGTHVRFQAKTAGESSQSVHPSSLNKFPTQDIAMEGSSKSHNAMEVCNSITNNGPNSRHDKNDEHFVDLEEASGNLKGINKATDIVTETNPCSAAEVIFSSNENKSFHEDASPNDSTAEISDDSSTLQGRRLESSLSPNDAADSDMTSSLIENLAAVEKPKQIMVSKSCLLDSNDHVEECPRVNYNQHSNNDPSYQTRNELKIDSQKLAVNESVFDLSGAQGDQDKNLAVSIKEKSHLEYLPCTAIGSTENISTSGLEASKLDKDPTISVLPTADDEKACREDNIPYSTVKCKVNETLSFGKCENDSSKADNDGANGHEEIQFEMSSVIKSWNEQENVSKKDDTDVFSHLLEVPGMQDLPKSQLVADDESMYHYENSDGEVCRRETKVPEFDSLENFGNGQSSDLFSSSCARISSNSITGTEQDTRLGCSSFTSTDKQLSGEDNMILMFNDTMGEHRQDPSEGILLDRSGVSEVSNEAYTSNKIYTTPANPSQLNGIENAGKHDLSLSFGSLQTDMCAESNRVERESYQANSFNIESVVNKTYADPTRSRILSSNIAADLEQDRPFGYPNLSFNDRTHEPPGSNFNVVHPERDWDGTRGNKIRNSSQNFMVGFGNSSLQTSESVAADGSWRTGHDNVFGDCFDANSGPRVPSSSFFPTFGLAPNKGQESSFGVNHNYGIQNDTSRPGRTQPVEYSFMGEQCVSSLPGEAKIFPYGTNTEQGMDTSFWLGNDALTPNASSHASQATCVCVWCRNVFFDEPVQAGMQTGAIGTICPSCSSRIPGQFNVL
ncbi:hypothetical protein C2S53_000851 [Perilla frutescens var. hirtella]|uniref:C2H2-type domain-containing protein n=1 Tax=Perilla frutescens var. hirtella TaxID=608512 RepID=A0AAD4NYE7_PERFH|nr:hypothetical protein C2S53_000851 [Perilla frutescens var. hirtella]